MLQRIFTLITLLAALPICLSAQLQKNDPVLFTVEDTPVHVSEFNYIYSKTNGKEADYSKKSLEEYLDLYKKFKLKVQKAKELQLDTIPSLKAELEGYRKQLADSYLIDREVTDKLLRELYDRVQEDVQISHIFVQIGDPAYAPMPEDSLPAYEKIWVIKKRLDKGESFEKLAQEESDDANAAKNKGSIGFLNAPLPNGFYEFETAAYTLPVGEVSNPVRTRIGYHIIRVDQKRPARGEVEIAHILARAKDGDFDAAKVKIDSIYTMLQQPGANFNAISQAYSDDEATVNRSGYLGIFGIGRYEKAFEDAAFGLEKDGAYSKPVRTSIGWHILKRISKRGIQPFDLEKNRLETKVKQDSRFEQAQVAMIEKIRTENNFKENKELLQAYIESQDSVDFFGFRWKPVMSSSDSILFTLGNDTKVSTKDFSEYMSKATGKRIRQKDQGVAVAVHTLYKEYLDDACLRFEEAHLEEKYPDFKSLMREYEEGILLFEATKRLVWDKASQDTVGLEKFYETVKDRYRWSERAVVESYTIKPEARSKVNDIRAYAEKHTAKELLAAYNTDESAIVSVDESTVEKKPGAQNVFVVGEVGRVNINRSGISTFDKIVKVLPPATKTLKEARGYIIADYQDYLEDVWVAELEKEYDLKVNKKVFESLIKK